MVDYSRKYLLSKINKQVKAWAATMTSALAQKSQVRVFASFHLAERIIDRLNGEYAIVLLVATKWIKSNPALLTQDVDVLIHYKDFRVLINCESQTMNENLSIRQVRLNTVLTNSETIPIREKNGKKMVFVTYTLKDI